MLVPRRPGIECDDRIFDGLIFDGLIQEKASVCWLPVIDTAGDHESFNRDGVVEDLRSAFGVAVTSGLIHLDVSA